MTTLYRWISKQLILHKVRSILFSIDLVGERCPLRCPTCPIGNIGPHKGKLMTQEKFRQILDKMSRETRIKSLLLWTWGDPFLHPDLHLFVEEVKRRKIRVELSTTLNGVKANLEKVMSANPDVLTVSFSGWNNAVLYHKGTCLGTVMRNMEIVSSKRVKTEVRISFHQYRANEIEKWRVRELADRLGFKLIPYDAQLISLEKVIYPHKMTPSDIEVIGWLKETPQQVMDRLPKSNGCYVQDKLISINADGMVELCCGLYGDEFKICNYLHASLNEILDKKRGAHICVDCKAVGGNVYREFEDKRLRDWGVRKK